MLDLQKSKTPAVVMAFFLFSSLCALFLLFLLNPKEKTPIAPFPVPTAFAGEEFRTQLLQITMPAGTGTLELEAPADFDTVNRYKTILLVSGVQGQGMGYADPSDDQTADESMVHAALASSTELVLQRASSVEEATVWILLVEYIGPSGGPNEFIVRQLYDFTWPDTLETQDVDLPLGGLDTPVADPDDAVVFLAGTYNPNSSQGYRRGDVRAYLLDEDTVRLDVGNADGDPIKILFQVVEFTGSNWKIQKGTTTPFAIPGESNISVDDVGNISAVWVYTQTSTVQGYINERGSRSFLSSPTNLKVQSAPDAVFDKTVQWYLIQNPQMRVQNVLIDDEHETDLMFTLSGFAPARSISNAFAWANGVIELQGVDTANHPVEAWQFGIASASSIEFLRGRAGNPLYAAVQLIELPTSSRGSIQAFPRPVSVRINNGSECTASRLVSVNLNALDARDFVLANELQFIGSVWERFDGSLQSVPWELEDGDGLKTIYVIFRSSSGNLSIVQEAHIFLDEEGGCGERVDDRKENAEIQEPLIPESESPESAPVPLEDCVVSCQDIQYDVFLLNPNGSQRGFLDARVDILGEGVRRIFYEDSVDMDFNDIVLRFDTSSCPVLRTTREQIDADWHHQIVLRAFGGGRVYQTVLWPDSQAREVEDVVLDLRQTSFCLQAGN